MASVILVQRSYELSYQANGELVNCDLGLHCWEASALKNVLSLLLQNSGW